MAKKKEVKFSESVSIGDEDLGASAEAEVNVSATFEKAAKEEIAKAEQEIKERVDKAARLVAQKAQEDAVLKEKKLAAEKAAAESAVKQAAEEERKRAEHAKRIAMRQAPVEKAASKLKDQFKF